MAAPEIKRYKYDDYKKWEGNWEINEVKIFENKNEFKEVKFQNEFEFEWNDCKSKIDFLKVF